MAIYRKFRPQTFSQVKGQDSIVRTLQNQIRNDRIGHAYLFTGTRGTGKTSVARIFAKAINCLHPENGEPCNVCDNCKAIAGGSFMDVIEIDAASNTGVDDIRRVIEEVQYTPVTGKYKVYIIDEAHMLSGAAANAFLKTLEEPPAYAVFILATTEPHKLPVTILSRCQRYDFKRISTDEITANIFAYLDQEGLPAEEKAVRYIARMGDGSMRDALSLLDKAVAFHTGNELTYEDALSALGTVDTEIFSRIFRCVISADAYTAVSELDKEVKNGKDISRFVGDFVWYLRNLLLIRVGDDKDLDMLGISEENLAGLKADAKLAEPEVLMRYIRILSELMNQLRFSGAKQVLLDVALIKLARPQTETDLESLYDRIRQLEAGITATGPVIRAQAPAPAPQPKEAPRAVYSQPQEIPQAVYSQPQEIPQAVYADPQEAFWEPQEAFSEPPEIVWDPREIPQETIPEPQDVFSEPAEKPAAVRTQAATPADTVCANWGQVIGGCSSPLLKVYLKDTKAEAVDADNIYVTVPGKLAEERLTIKRNEIRELIRSLFGCDVDLRISTEPAPAKGPAETEEEKLTALLKKNIKMNIETEDA